MGEFLAFCEDELTVPLSSCWDDTCRTVTLTLTADMQSVAQGRVCKGSRRGSSYCRAMQQGKTLLLIPYHFVSGDEDRRWSASYGYNNKGSWYGNQWNYFIWSMQKIFTGHLPCSRHLFSHWDTSVSQVNRDSWPWGGSTCLYWGSQEGCGENKRASGSWGQTGRVWQTLWGLVDPCEWDTQSVCQAPVENSTVKIGWLRKGFFTKRLFKKGREA